MLDEDERFQNWWDHHGKYMTEDGQFRRSPDYRLKRRRMRINKIKTDFGCISCGYNEHAAALQFDHRIRSLKKNTVSSMMGSTLKKLFEEIRKCDVRCANCHFIKTTEEKEYKKLNDKYPWEKVCRETKVDKLKVLKAYELLKSGASVKEIVAETRLLFWVVRDLVETVEVEKAKLKRLAKEKTDGRCTQTTIFQ